MNYKNLWILKDIEINRHKQFKNQKLKNTKNYSFNKINILFIILIFNYNLFLDDEISEPKINQIFIYIKWIQTYGSKKFQRILDRFENFLT